MISIYIADIKDLQAVQKFQDLDSANLQFVIVSTFSVLLLSSCLSLLVSVSHSSLSNCSGETEACESMWFCRIKDKAVKRLGKESRK